MKLQLKPLIAALGLMAVLSGNAHAQATTGSLLGWQTNGDIVSAGGAITLTTAFMDGDGDQTYNLSGTSAIDVLFDDMGGLAGVDITAFDIGGEFAVEGSLITQSFNAVAGQTLSFDWSFTTHETTYLDNAFVIIDHQLVSLATTAQPGIGSQKYSFTFAQSGLVTLSLGVVDTESVAGVSLLSFSNLQLGAATAPIPEPGTYALMLGGLGVLGFVARRRRGNAGRQPR